MRGQFTEKDPADKSIPSITNVKSFYKFWNRKEFCKSENGFLMVWNREMWNSILLAKKMPVVAVQRVDSVGNSGRRNYGIIGGELIGGDIMESEKSAGYFSDEAGERTFVPAIGIGESMPCACGCDIKETTFCNNSFVGLSTGEDIVVEIEKINRVPFKTF